MNVAIEGHPLVGMSLPYHKDLPPVRDELSPSLILGNGMRVKVAAAFQDWNGVAGLDMLYVFVPDTGYHTHVPPRALGLGRITPGGAAPLSLDWEAHGMGECAWQDLAYGSRPAWAAFDCWGRAAQVGDGKYSILCEGHHNRTAPGH